MTITADDDEIRKPVSDCVTGMARGNGPLLRSAFHPDVSIIASFQGALERTGVEAFIESCMSERTAESATVPDWKIESIDIAGDTAVVRCVNVWAGLSFRDTLSLLRGRDRWSIVAKLFHHLG